MTRIARGWLLGDAPDEVIPDTVLLPIENPDLHDARSFSEHLTERETYGTMTVGTHAGRRVGLCTSKFGAPAVAMTVGVLADAGVRRIIGVGYCGGLHEQVRCGDIVIPQACVRDEGTSERYVALGFPALADPTLLMHGQRIAGTLGIPWHSGVVWTTDAVLRETTALVEHWSALGCLGVDMESSALYTVARLHRVAALAILVASDNPKTRKPTHGETLSRGSATSIRLGFDIAACVAERPA